MTISNTPLMRAINAKMDYLNKRQGIISQNIANADTPGYQSKDLTKVDFGAVLKETTGMKKVRIETTNPLHMGGANEVGRSRDQKDKLTYEVSPDRNGVILEEQLVKSQQTQMDYNLLASLSSKQGMMYKIAIGSQG